MATLGAELGCGRHLASTVVTGSGQRSSTFLAELCLSTVLVLALRAFHCRPRRKKRARCPARVTSRMVDASRFSCGGQDRHRRLLCPRYQRPPRRRAADKRDELAPLYPNHAIPRACGVWDAARSRRPGARAMTKRKREPTQPVKPQSGLPATYEEAMIRFAMAEVDQIEHFLTGS